MANLKNIRFMNEDSFNNLSSTNNNDIYFVEYSEPIIPTTVSELINDAGYLTQHQDISGKADKATTLAGYGINDAYTKTEVDSKLTSVYRYKGTVSTFNDLPTTDNVEGDVYNVELTGDNYAWVDEAEIDGEIVDAHWDKLAGIIDLSNYVKASDISTVATSGSYTDLVDKPNLSSVTLRSWL